jgi:predicted deacylase
VSSARAERRIVRFDHELLRDLEHPAFEARGEADGPHVALIGGIHGCEYSSIAAVTKVMSELDVSELRGSITAVPVVSMQSYVERKPFVVPADGKNLNRSFPGSYDGTYADVLARSIYDELIAPADVLIDLHGGDMVEALEPFSLYETGPAADDADALAIAFGLPYVVREEPRAGGLGGMTASVAAQAGKPGIIAEAGGCGLLSEDATNLLADGAVNALRHLGMLPGDPAPPPRPLHRVGRFDRLRSQAAGWWVPAVHAGEEVHEGTLLGRVRNLWGDVQEDIRSPSDGVVLFLTTSPAVSDDGLLLGLGAELERIAP